MLEKTPSSIWYLSTPMSARKWNKIYKVLRQILMKIKWTKIKRKPALTIPPRRMIAASRLLTKCKVWDCPPIRILWAQPSNILTNITKITAWPPLITHKFINTRQIYRRNSKMSRIQICWMALTSQAQSIQPWTLAIEMINLLKKI